MPPRDIVIVNCLYILLITYLLLFAIFVCLFVLIYASNLLFGSKNTDWRPAKYKCKPKFNESYLLTSFPQHWNVSLNLVQHHHIALRDCDLVYTWKQNGVIKMTILLHTEGRKCHFWMFPHIKSSLQTKLFTSQETSSKQATPCHVSFLVSGRCLVSLVVFCVEE